MSTTSLDNIVYHALRKIIWCDLTDKFRSTASDPRLSACLHRARVGAEDWSLGDDHARDMVGLFTIALYIRSRSHMKSHRNGRCLWCKGLIRYGGIGSLADPEDLDVQPDASIHESMIVQLQCLKPLQYEAHVIPRSPAKSSSYQGPPCMHDPRCSI
jgi:hypothetical protein